MLFRSAEGRPRVTIVIACRNEARRLREKIANALAVDYDDKEIIVASDASDDGSDSIAAEFADGGVRVVRSSERRGKEFAQGLAIQAATGDVIVFTDAGTDLPAESISEIVRAFSDPMVGAVSSEDSFVSIDGKTVGEGLYVRYEMWLRKLESERQGLVGLSGSFFAVRKALLRVWDAAIPSDFACALLTRDAGLVSVSSRAVRGIYRDVADPSAEYARKVRTGVRGMAAIIARPGVLNPFRYGLFSFQVWSHKLMRWLVPWFLAGLFVSSWWLASAGTIYVVFLLLQCLAYLAVALAHIFKTLRRMSLVRIAYYFVQVNLALAVAGVLVLSGRRIVTWTPSARSSAAS